MCPSVVFLLDVRLSRVLDRDDDDDDADKERLCVLLDLVEPRLNVAWCTPSKVCSSGFDPILTLSPLRAVALVLSFSWDA